MTKPHTPARRRPGLERQPRSAGIQVPEVSLAAAKVQRMWDDCVVRLVSNNSRADCATAAERAQAERFCMAPSGYWARSREWFCWAAGIDPDVLRERALRRRNAGGDAAPASSAVAQVAAEDRAAAPAAPVMGVSSRNSAGRGQPRPATFSGDAR